MTVHLVGAGPGDPGLLTCRAERLLEVADVVVHDRLVSAEVLALVNPAAELVDVGKAPGHGTITQSEIDALLIERGRRHECVVRLKGGDPYVFGRGGEESAALLAAGVRCEVVPGVTSAFAAPAAAGIAVMARDTAACVTVVTGHVAPDRPDAVDWRSLARTGGTLVVLMGVTHLATITAELIAGGLDPATPAAAVRRATSPDQEVVRSTLGALADCDLHAPSTIVIGAAASRAETAAELAARA